MSNEKDIDVLARTLWGEARGEGFNGMIAVGWTIRNRVFDGKSNSWWGEGYAGVCQKAWQFSCWNKSDPNSAYLRGEKAIPADQFALAKKAAETVIEGLIPDPTGKATHYFSTSMKTPPAWAAVGTKTVQLGRHLFYKDVK
jgi:spore germination cell wall hydrolase CwlJ-like protein